MAGSNFEPMLGLSPRNICGLVGAVSCPAFFRDDVFFLGMSPGMLLSELGAVVKRLGCTVKRRCEASGGLPGTTCCALNEAPALRGRALIRCLLSPISRLLASLPLLESAEALALAFRLPLVAGLRTVIGRALALVRYVFTVVGGSLALIGDPVAVIRDPVALIRGLLTFVRNPLALVGDPVVHRQVQRPTTAAPLTSQPVTVALQRRIIARELRFPAPDL